MFPFFGRWRAQRDRDNRAAQYVAVLMEEPAEADVLWLAETASRGDVDHARWELRYGRRALGLLAAERDALDDRTASIVARVLSQELAKDPSIARDALDLAQRQFNARLSAYRDALAARAGAPTQVRLGQTLFAFAGGSFQSADANITRASELLSSYLGAAGDALKETFGAASLPDNIPPSALIDRK